MPRLDATSQVKSVREQTAMDLRAKCAIAGLGQTRMGKNFDHPSATGFAAEAVNLALEDAGLKRSDLDGLLVNPGITWFNNPMASYSLQQAMGLRNLRLTATMNLGGATAAAMIMHAAQSIAAGMAECVACVFADAPLQSAVTRQGKRAKVPPPLTALRSGLDAALRTVRRQRAVCVRRRAAYGSLRHDQRSPRRDRRRRACSGPTRIPTPSSTTRR